MQQSRRPNRQPRDQAGHYTRDKLSVGPKQREEERREERKVCPLRWELRQQFPGYEVKQYNIIIDTLGGWSQEMNTTTGLKV